MPRGLAVIDALWSSNVTPQQLVRMMGSRFGRRSVRRVLGARISHLAEEDAQLLVRTSSMLGSIKKLWKRWCSFAWENQLNVDVLCNFVLKADYLYHITVARASGEYAMNSLLEPVQSKSKGIGVFAREPLSPVINQIDVESLTVMYGDHDWMRPNDVGTRQIEASLSELPCRQNLAIVPKAGHHLYMDNTDMFHRLVLQ